jgi:hypothetical protein
MPPVFCVKKLIAGRGQSVGRAIEDLHGSCVHSEPTFSCGNPDGKVAEAIAVEVGASNARAAAGSSHLRCSPMAFPGTRDSSSHGSGLPLPFDPLRAPTVVETREATVSAKTAVTSMRM